MQKMQLRFGVHCHGDKASGCMKLMYHAYMQLSQTQSVHCLDFDMMCKCFACCKPRHAGSQILCILRMETYSTALKAACVG